MPKSIMYFNKPQLRWYLGFIGVVGLIYCSIDLLGAMTARPIFSTSASIINLFSLLWGWVVSAGFIYFTCTLPTYLRSDKVRSLKICINVLFGIGFVWGVVNYISGVNSLGLRGLFILFPLELFLWWYLYRNITRLSKR